MSVVILEDKSPTLECYPEVRKVELVCYGSFGIECTKNLSTCSWTCPCLKRAHTTFNVIKGIFIAALKYLYTLYIV